MVITTKDLRYEIEEYVEFYNQQRWHQSLNYETPAEVYFKQEREACRYLDASFGPASAPSGREEKPWTTHKPPLTTLAGFATTYPQVQ